MNDWLNLCEEIDELQDELSMTPEQAGFDAGDRVIVTGFGQFAGQAGTVKEIKKGLFVKAVVEIDGDLDGPRVFKLDQLTIG